MLDKALALAAIGTPPTLPRMPAAAIKLTELNCPTEMLNVLDAIDYIARTFGLPIILLCPQVSLLPSIMSGSPLAKTVLAPGKVTPIQ